eukprot:g31888.t2
MDGLPQDVLEERLQKLKAEAPEDLVRLDRGKEEAGREGDAKPAPSSPPAKSSTPATIDASPESNSQCLQPTTLTQLILGSEAAKCAAAAAATGCSLSRSNWDCWSCRTSAARRRCVPACFCALNNTVNKGLDHWSSLQCLTARAETAALSYRPDIQEDSSWMRTTEERLAGHEQDLFDLRERVEELIQGDPDGKPLRDNEDVENIRRRLEVLEEQGTAVEDPETTRMVQVQNTICDLVEQVSKLKQHASSAEANSSSWQQQVKQIHSLIERKQNEDAASLRVNGEVEAKVGALSSQVADIAARLLEVEGNLDFVRETEQSSLTEAPNSGVAGPGTQGSGGGNAALQEKLEAVALHLEIVDDLTERLGDLERKWNAGPEPHGMGSPPGPLSEVSFGGEAPVKASAPSDHLGRELGDLQLRFDANDTKLKSIHEELRTKLALAKADSQGTQAQLNDLAARLGGDEQILSTLQEAPAVSFADLDALRLEFADKFDQMQPSTEQVEPETKDTSLIAGELMEVKHVVKELSEKVNSNHLNLDDLQESLAQLAANTKAFEATVPGMKEEIKELRSRLPNADAEASAEQAILEKLEEVDADLKYCKFECGTFAKGGDLGHLRDRVKELEEIAQKPTKGERMIKDVQELIKGKYQQQEEIMKDLKKFYELEARFDATKVETDTELQKLCAMINDLQKEQIEEPKEGESNLESMADLKDQIAALEQKIDSVSGEHVIDRAEASAEDVKLRSQVQQQVQDIGMQLSKEVANLAEHQRDLVETRCSLEDLNKKFDDVTGLENQITHVAERLSSTESVVSTAKKELEDMRTEVTNLLGRITDFEALGENDLLKTTGEDFFTSVLGEEASLVDREQFQIWAVQSVASISVRCENRMALCWNAGQGSTNRSCSFFFTNFSSNGTMVNDQLLSIGGEQVPLKDGDRIALQREGEQGDTRTTLLEFRFDLRGSILKEIDIT